MRMWHSISRHQVDQRMGHGYLLIAHFPTIMDITRDFPSCGLLRASTVEVGQTLHTGRCPKYRRARRRPIWQARICFRLVQTALAVSRMSNFRHLPLRVVESKSTFLATGGAKPSSDETRPPLHTEWAPQSRLGST